VAKIVERANNRVNKWRWVEKRMEEFNKNISIFSLPFCRQMFCVEGRKKRENLFRGSNRLILEN
jgi:hypothetical protein